MISTPKKKGSFFQGIKVIWQNRQVKKIGWFLAFFLGILSIFALHFFPDNLPVHEGQVSPKTIKAPQTITFEDTKKTEERRRLAEERIEEVYLLDGSVLMKMEEELSQVFENLITVLADEKLSNLEKMEFLKSEYNLAESAVRALVSLDSSTLKTLFIEAEEILRNHWQTGVRDFEVDEKKAMIYTQIDLLNITTPYKNLLKAVFNKVEFKPNYLKDETATRRAKEEASRDEGVVMVTVRKGQKIVGEGEIVTAEHLDVLQALGYKKSSAPYLALLGIGLFMILVFVLTNFYWQHYRRDLARAEVNYVLLGLLVFIILLLAKVISAINISSNPEIAEMVGYLIPVAAVSMLIAFLLDATLAIFMTILLAFFIGFLTGNQLPFTINAFIGGLVGIYSVSKFNQRFDWVKAGLFIACAQVVCIVSLGLLNNNQGMVLLIGAGFGVINGIFSSIFAYGSLPFLESAFEITTSARLLELANPNQPLLKRLLLEAPGTYHHSILVGNLGEAAADLIGADSLLVRVGAYYHDLGKLKRPYFFIENQLGGENPHDKLSPSLSTLIITSHLKDGVEIAKENNLPAVVIDLIAQHHGTSLVSYFYHQALENDDSQQIDEAEYRYLGPKPQTKEAAIIMLADSVEAAVRSMPAPSSGKIEGLVRKILKERLTDGQLEESPLTFKDLDLIAVAFTRILNGIFHKRIEYPENVLKAIKGGSSGNADTDLQSARKGSLSTSVSEND
ncbi:MAG TPA: HDIG domain-containing protein [Clostridia bacterium]|jgi:putative nucleotidyltransferase with HDIG domain|nr:HDIG domain-containing protein [Clostridia bacterium]